MAVGAEARLFDGLWMHLIDGGQSLEAAVQGEDTEKRVPHSGFNVAQTDTNNH